MSASYTIDITAEDLEGGGRYSNLDLPADLVFRVSDITEYDKRDEGKTAGWIWTLKSMDNDPSLNVNGLEFKWFTAKTANSKFKWVQIANACGKDVSEGQLSFDADDYLDNILMGRVDYPAGWYAAQESGSEYLGKLSDSGEPYREVQRVWPVDDVAPASYTDRAVTSYKIDRDKVSLS